MLGLSSWGVQAADTVPFDDPIAEAPLPVLSADAVVTINPVPMPVRVTELLHDVASSAEARPGKKLKIAKKKSLPTAMLSRTERHQMALAAASQKPDSVLLDFFNDEDFESGIERLDLHRSFSRPKVMKVADQDEEDNDPDISEAVKLRLFLARMKAVRAHEKKFS